MPRYIVILFALLLLGCNEEPTMLGKDCEFDKFGCDTITDFFMILLTIFLISVTSVYLISLTAVHLISIFFAKVSNIKIKAVYVAIICLSAYNLIVFTLFYALEISLSSLPSISIVFLLSAFTTTPFLIAFFIVWFVIKLLREKSQPFLQQEQP